MSDSFVIPYTVTHWAPLSIRFHRQEYWSGLPFPPPWDLPNPGMEPMSLVSPALAGWFFFKLINLWLAGSLMLCELFSSCRVGVSCGAWASHCRGFFCCGAWALRMLASVAVVRGLSSCSSWALEQDSTRVFSKMSTEPRLKNPYLGLPWCSPTADLGLLQAFPWTMALSL